jgi:hypothetical protein
MNLLTLKLLASRKARMQMLDVIEALPPEQHREKHWGLERVERTNKLEERFIANAVMLTPPALLLSIIFASILLAFIILVINLIVMFQWVNPRQPRDIEFRIKHIRHSFE